MSTVQEHLAIGPASHGMRMTLEQFDAPGDWDELYVYELVNGVLIVNPPPSEAERGPNELLGRMLWTYHERHPERSTFNYTLSEHTVNTPNNRRRADRVVWTGLDRMPNVRRDLPTIVIEFVSPDRRDHERDYVEKRSEYGSIGIREYWIIDRFRRQMTVVRWDEDDCQEMTMSETDVYTTPLLPGFELPLASLLAEADMLMRDTSNEE
ncbi:MAG: Uma2 family endonuclease [Planctomycetes bacterium]|nr:Uma2 family endonuclease [Planctomycetota bacterium]MBL7037194.1 Uma2 family endonuclease [Pirellulaceae bacterium]